MNEKETIEQAANYEGATVLEATMWLQENLPTQAIKGNPHCSPNAKILYMKRFKCFQNYTVTSYTTQTELRAEIREYIEGETEKYILRGSASLPLYCVPQDTNGNAFKKAETSLIGRALRSVGILSIKEIKDDEDGATTGSAGFQNGGFQNGGFQNQGQQQNQVQQNNQPQFQGGGFQNGQQNGGFQNK